MCVIAYKPTNVNFPSETILKNCYDNNSDGAGFMYAWKGKVYIQKGFLSYQSFKDALDKARIKTGDNVPYVMHFRIATQGFEKTMTHPFPLSSKMKNLKKTKTEANIGVAHNGVLSLTSDGSKDYSDTMKFITDYLSLIIRGYDWYEDERTKTLIERLIEGSRLAILDKNGHCSLMGKGWVEDNGMFYSNSSYSYKKQVFPAWSDSWYDDGICFRSYGYGKHKKSPVTSSPAYSNAFSDPWEDRYDEDEGLYDFKEDVCPYTMEDVDDYCCMCKNSEHCKFVGLIDSVTAGDGSHESASHSTREYPAWFDNFLDDVEEAANDKRLKA